MNRQRKVLITITYNEMGIIIDTKAEEVAQPAPRWIPSSEALPEDDERVLCQTVTKKGRINMVIGYHTADLGWCCGMNSNVVAWQHLPEPWKDGD